MKIGLVDVDSHNFPNLCLMKLSEYHTRRGDWVEWWNPKGRYDLVYKSRVFTDTYSKDTIEVNNAEQVIQGGTGYGPGGKDLPYEIEHIRPDYFLYTEIPELTPCILHEFIEKIVVHAASDPKGKNRTQEIDIYYKGIGALEVSKVTSSRQE